MKNNFVMLPASQSGSSFFNWLRSFNIPVFVFELGNHEQPDFAGTIDGKEVRLLGWNEVNAFVEEYQKTHTPIAA